jgi:hypothetical protein
MLDEEFTTIGEDVFNLLYQTTGNVGCTLGIKVGYEF